MASSSNYVAVEEYNALLKLLNTQFTNMMGRFDEIDKQFSNIDKRLERLDTIEERLNIIESHLTTIDNRLSHLETNTVLPFLLVFLHFRLLLSYSLTAIPRSIDYKQTSSKPAIHGSPPFDSSRMRWLRS